MSNTFDKFGVVNKDTPEQGRKEAEEVKQQEASLLTKQSIAHTLINAAAPPKKA